MHVIQELFVYFVWMLYHNWGMLLFNQVVVPRPRCLAVPYEESSLTSRECWTFVLKTNKNSSSEIGIVIETYWKALSLWKGLLDFHLLLLKCSHIQSSIGVLLY